MRHLGSSRTASAARANGRDDSPSDGNAGDPRSVPARQILAWLSREGRVRSVCYIADVSESHETAGCLLLGRAGAEPAENVPDSNSEAWYAGLAATLARLDGDPVAKCQHGLSTSQYAIRIASPPAPHVSWN